MTSRWWMLLAVTPLIVVAACSGGSDDADTSTPTESAAPGDSGEATGGPVDLEALQRTDPVVVDAVRGHPLRPARLPVLVVGRARGGLRTLAPAVDRTAGDHARCRRPGRRARRCARPTGRRRRPRGADRRPRGPHRADVPSRRPTRDVRDDRVRSPDRRARGARPRRARRGTRNDRRRHHHGLRFTGDQRATGDPAPATRLPAVRRPDRAEEGHRPRPLRHHTDRVPAWHTGRCDVSCHRRRARRRVGRQRHLERVRPDHLHLLAGARRHRHGRCVGSDPQPRSVGLRPGTHRQPRQLRLRRAVRRLGRRLGHPRRARGGPAQLFLHVGGGNLRRGPLRIDPHRPTPEGSRWSLALRQLLGRQRQLLRRQVQADCDRVHVELHLGRRRTVRFGFVRQLRGLAQLRPLHHRRRSSDHLLEADGHRGPRVRPGDRATRRRGPHVHGGRRRRQQRCGRSRTRGRAAGTSAPAT